MSTNDGESANIPIVDFSKFLDGSQNEKEQVARDIDDAFRTAGFVYLKGHGVPQDKVDECFEWVRLSNFFRKKSHGLVGVVLLEAPSMSIFMCYFLRLIHFGVIKGTYDLSVIDFHSSLELIGL